MIFLLSCSLRGWQAGFDHSHYRWVWFVFTEASLEPQADWHSCGTSKEKREFHERWEVFIYFALIFLKEAFQGSFCTDSLKLATLAQLLSLRGANNLISLLFTCPKFRSLACSVGRSCPTCYCSSAFHEWKSPSWLYTGELENLISFLAVLAFVSSQPEPQPAPGAWQNRPHGCWKLLCFM